jgi:hypothetical protein
MHALDRVSAGVDIRPFRGRARVGVHEDHVAFFDLHRQVFEKRELRSVQLDRVSIDHTSRIGIHRSARDRRTAAAS